MTLEEIIDGCKRVDTRCQTKLFEKFYSQMLSICIGYSKDADEAKDLLQEGFISIFNKIPTFKNGNEKSIYSWIIKIMRNKCIDEVRKKKNFIKVDVTDNLFVPEFDFDSDFDVRLAKLPSLVEKLTPRYRENVKLYYYEDKTHKEIGAIMGIGEGTSKSNIVKGRENIKKMLLEL